MVEDAPPTFECYYYGEPCNWFFLGSSGRAMTFWRLYYTTLETDPVKAADYLAMAKSYIDGSLSRISTEFDEYISFVNGNVGVYSIASVIYDALGETD
jgi:hypothetical protein